MTTTYGTLMDYVTGESIRPATAEEAYRSTNAAAKDGGAGVIDVDGRRCYVEGEPVVLCTGCGEHCLQAEATRHDHADTYSGTTWHCPACDAVCSTDEE